ncbi:MAG TPA: TatD family hydrolase [Kofleriaceae bacterium]
MIDTHCHLDLEAFDEDRDAAIARATAAGVVGMLVPAVRPVTWAALGALAAKHASVGLRCAIGIHPQVVPELAEGEVATDIDELAAVIARAAVALGAVAIGETGLDGATGEMERQEAIFRAHIRAARATKLPLVIHVLKAHDTAPRILREEKAGPGVLHSYSGGADLVAVYRDLGMAFSFAGPVTYPNARRPVEAARAIPAELLLAETDAPDQAPEGHRGGRSEPAFVAAVIAGLARARGITTEEMTALTTENARRLFATWC